jgi:type IV secretory pathway TrbD component
MNRFLQRFSAVLIAVALLLVQVAPVAAATGQDLENRGQTNLVADAMILRPLGLVAIGLGAAVWAVGVAPFVAITRPTELDESMSYLIMRPVRYTFADPLGHH